MIAMELEVYNNKIQNYAIVLTLHISLGDRKVTKRKYVYYENVLYKGVRLSKNKIRYDSLS